MSSNEDASKIEAQEAEMNRLRKVEDFNSTQHNLLQQKIDEANQNIATLETEAATNANNVDHKVSQGLEERLNTLQAEVSRKEEECSSMKQELGVANAAKLTLESGKAKAKGEIHALLLRVQDSERWKKSIKDKLEKFGISTSTEPFPETWNKLEMLLQSAIASGFPEVSSNNPLQQVGCTPKGNILSTPRKVCESPSQFVQTTELIYRTQNIPTYSSPTGHETCTTIDTVPDSQMSTNIVPFSSFQKQLSPVHCSTPNHDAGDFATILTQTPQKEYPKEDNSPIKESKNNLSSSSGTEKDEKSLSPVKLTNKTSQTNDDKTPRKQLRGADLIDGGEGEQPHDTDFGGDKHRVVTFESQDTVNPGSKRSHEKTTEGFPNERPVRPNRRTYSRIRKASPVRKNERFAVQNEAPPSAQKAGSDSPYDNRNKRARVSTASNQSRSHKQTHSGSDYVERRASPASLASGSSRQNTANENSNQRWATRGQRRSGRRTRGKNPDICRVISILNFTGERYNARFSQDNISR